MGVLYDYFIAPSDRDAASTLGRSGGPGVAPAARRSLFGRTKGEAMPAYVTVSDTGIDPVVQAGTLEELLTGRSYDELKSDPKWGTSVAVSDGGGNLVLNVTDALISALADSDDDRLAAVAVPWSQTEEFWGQGDPEVLGSILKDLAHLARRAKDEGHSVYCWASV